MHVVLISGGRNPGGETAEALGAMLEGVRIGGGDGEVVSLAQLRLEQCRGCNDFLDVPCRLAGQCDLEDDFASILEKIRRADAAVFASPVHLTGCTESVRALVNRMQHICEHEKASEGVEGAPAIVVCIGGGAVRCANMLKKALAECGLDVAAMVTMGRRRLHLKRKLLNDTGRRLAESLLAGIYTPVVGRRRRTPPN